MLRIRSYFTRSYMIFGFCSFVMLPVIGIQWLLTGYYGMNVCVPFLQIPMWKPSPSPCDGIRKWGLLEMIRMRWGQEGIALMNGISALTKPQENLLSLSALCHMRSWQSATKNRVLQQSWNPDLGLPAPEVWEMNFCCWQVTQSIVCCHSRLSGWRHESHCLASVAQ